MDFPEINGFGHLDFTVTNMDRSVRWWEQVMGFQLVARRETPDYKLSNVLHPSLVPLGSCSTRIPPATGSTNAPSVSITSRCAFLTEPHSKPGRSTSMTLASHTQASRRRAAAR